MDDGAACAKAGAVFVGPPVAALNAMGSKSHAKETMRQAGIPVLSGNVPGTVPA